MTSWMQLESDADTLHAACERENAERRSDERWGAILFATCAAIVAGLIVNVAMWLS